MQKLNEVPKEIREQKKEREEKEFEKKFRQYQHFCTLPIRPVRMRVKRKEKEKSLEQVIVPETAIYIHKDGFVEGGWIDRNSLTYTILKTKKPFPYGHIYKATGHVCLGSIFVPSLVSRYSPQLPLETLFLHNDRNTHHGNANVSITMDMLHTVRTILEANGVQLSEDAMGAFGPGQNLVATDGIWLLASDVTSQLELFQAMRVMETIYNIIF